MKQVVFIGKMNGYITPEKQAEFLSKHGHLEGILGVDSDIGCLTTKYYTYNGGGFKVIYVGGQVAQVDRMDADEIKRIVSCSKLKFGGF